MPPSVAKLLVALDSDAFDERESAASGLAKLGDLAEPALRKALEAKPTLEVRTPNGRAGE